MRSKIIGALIALFLVTSLPGYGADVARTNPQLGVTQGYSQKTIGNNTTLVPYVKTENQLTVLDTLDATTGWAAFNTDADNLAATDAGHTLGTNALTFDKVDGAANTAIAAIAKTLSSVDLSNYTLDDFITISFLVPTLTDVANVFIRLGTSASHYNQWTVADTDLTANVWLTANIPIGNLTSVTGTGWNPSDIDYIVFGVTFDAEGDTLAGIIVDDIAINGAQLTPGVQTGTTSLVSDINLLQIAGTAVTAGAGTVTAGTQRITHASDDPVTTSVQLLDNAISGAGFNITQLGGAAVPIGPGLEATAVRVTLPTDGTGIVGLSAVDNAVLDQIELNTDPLLVVGGGTEATAQRVTIASDSTGVLSIDDNGGSLTVDGTVAVSNTAIIGPSNPTGFDSYQQYAINLTTGADQVLVSSAANKQVWVYGITLTCGDAAGQTISFQDEDNVALSGIVEVSQYGGFSVTPSGNFNMPTFKLGTDKDFEIDITGGDCDGFITAAVVDVS